MEIKEKKDLERYALHGPTLCLHFFNPPPKATPDFPQ